MKPRNDSQQKSQSKLATICATCSIAAALLFTLPLRADKKQDLQKLLMHPEFISILKIIGEINSSMRLAAENPMDNWRREKVRKAVAAFPEALKALGSVFQSNKLGDSKLPLMQQVLGGYVDVNAADNYNKFLNHPDAKYIPRVGADFPSKYLNNSQIGSGNRQSIVFDENAQKGMPQLNPKTVDSKMTEGALYEELADLERQLEKAGTVKKAGPAGNGRIPTTRKPANAPQGLQLNPKFFKAIPLSTLLRLMGEVPAYAEEEEEKESGKGGAEFLFGLAAIMGAASPMVSAAIQAKADKAIAKTNQETAIATTQISANTSKFLAETQKGITEQQISATQQIATLNNSETTKRLELQLGELKKAREENNQISREKRNVEFNLNQQRIALAQKQADDNIALARATLSAQLAQSGLSQGPATNQLSVTPTLGSTGGVGINGGLAPRTPFSPTAKLATTVGSNRTARSGSVVSKALTASSKLLATIRDEASVNINQQINKLRRGMRKGTFVRGTRRAIAAVGAAVGLPAISRQLSQSLQSNQDVIGSTPNAQKRILPDALRPGLPVGESFAEYKKRVLSTVQLGAEPTRHTESERPGYKPPSNLISEGSTHSISSSSAKGFFKLPAR